MKAPARALLTTLHRSNLKLVAAVMATAWITITVIAYVNLRVYGDQSLQRVAQSIALSSQAATVFHDDAAAREVLVQNGVQEGLVSADIIQEGGEPLSGFRLERTGPLSSWLMTLGDLLFPQSSTAEIRVSGRRVGEVRVRGNSAMYIEFFGKTLAAALVCLVVVSVFMARVSRELERKVVGPLKELAALTHVVRLSRRFDRRAPPTDIAEINQLGDDFNALLAELETLERTRAEHAHTLQLANERLEHQLRHDGLTGLPNRGYFQERLTEQLAQAVRETQRIGVLYVDYDNFKSVNDQFGHAAGDDLLIEAGRRITAILRAGDLVARLGGDEFGVILGPLGSAAEAEGIAGQIVTAMHEPIRIEGQASIVSSVSVGVALYPDHALTQQRLLSAADLAMYRAKTEKRNAYAMAQADAEIHPPAPGKP